MGRFDKGHGEIQWTDENFGINIHGYIVKRFATGEIYLYHRLIAEEVLGRQLDKLEDVHHINGDKVDNSIENLCVLHFHKHRLYHGWYSWISQRRGIPNRENQLRRLRELNAIFLIDHMNKKTGSR